MQRDEIDSNILIVLIFSPIRFLLSGEVRNWHNVMKRMKGFRFIGYNKSSYIFLSCDLIFKPFEHHTICKMILETGKYSIGQHEIMIGN